MAGLDRYSKGKAWLEKMGWKEGQGLGKNNDGIKKYIGVVKKSDTAGVGVDKFQWDNMWWDNMYKKAAKNITPGSEVKAVEPKQADPLYYGTFTKTTNDESSDEEKGQVEGEELLQKCEGRLLRRYVPEGKLKRIKHQEAKFVNGEDLTPPTPSPKTAEKPTSTVKKAAVEKSEKSDVSEDSDSSEALSSEGEEEEEKQRAEEKKSKKEKKRKDRDSKKRKRDSEASSSESEDEESEKKAKKKEKREKKEKKEKKERKRHAKDKTDKDKKKKKHHKDKSSKEKKKHKKIKS